MWALARQESGGWWCAVDPYTTSRHSVSDGSVHARCPTYGWCPTYGFGVHLALRLLRADLGEQVHQLMLDVVAGGTFGQEEDRLARGELGQLRGVHVG